MRSCGPSAPFTTTAPSTRRSSRCRATTTCSMRYGDNPQYIRPSGLFNDPPEHTVFRRLFNRAFTPRTVARLETQITEIGNRLLDDLVDHTAADFHESYASRLP